MHCYHTLHYTMQKFALHHFTLVYQRLTLVPAFTNQKKSEDFRGYPGGLVAFNDFVYDIFIDLLGESSY